MLKAAVFGSPVAHSLSPVLHQAGYAAAGLANWSYGRREVAAAELVDVVGLLDDSWRGLSLTMPLKEAAFAVATTVSAVARRAGAINTLTRRADGGWDATNTDVAGIVAALAHVEHGGRGMVLGSGATARSAVLALAELGVRHLDLAARNPAATEEVLALAQSLGLSASPIPLERWAEASGAVVISTLPPAASGSVAACAAGESRRDLDGLTLLDVVYADWPTPLARAVLAAGGAVVSGLDMLVHQAAAQFELFTGSRAPIDAMFAAGRAALAARSGS